MHAIEFIEDLAVMLLIAGFISVLFHQLKQPVVLGYIISGVIIGPHTPPFALIQDEQTINTLAQLGIVFLMFSLGLQFSLRNLSRVGLGVITTALIEIILMIWIGFKIGAWFGWGKLDAIFLGAMLAISSTTIIIKALTELKLEKREFVQWIFGILIIEDILGIAILGILSSIAVTGSIQVNEIFFTMGKLLIFLIVTLVVGLLTVPRLLAYVGKFHSNEMLLITILGLCFGFCLLVIKLEYSIALGAFIIGSIMAESKELKKIEQLIGPIRYMFSAIFFISIGLLLNPTTVVEYAIPIFIITLAVIMGKVFSCSFGTLLWGKSGKTSLQVGMGLAQIGEFSFIIAALGSSLNVTSAFLFPIAVAVSVITTFLTPYLIRFAPLLASGLKMICPRKLVHALSLYESFIKNMTPKEQQVELARIFRRGFLQILVNFALVIAIFWLGSYFAGNISMRQKTLVWSGLLIVSLPFLIAIYRKAKGLSMLFAEMSISNQKIGKYTVLVRRIITEVVPAILIMGILLFIVLLSGSMFPPSQFLILVICLVLLALVLLWRWFIKLHAKLHIALKEGIRKEKD